LTVVRVFAVSSFVLVVYVCTISIVFVYLADLRVRVCVNIQSSFNICPFPLGYLAFSELEAVGLEDDL
jgi:hypothetical protein